MSRILIVEDESHLAQGLLFNLEAEGHEASVVETGESALESLGQRDFDLIVLDVMLPGVSGFEVAKDLRGRGNYVPILMLTARSRAEDVLEGLEAGADDYLPKPFELSILLARIRSLLRRSQWSHHKASAPREDSEEAVPIETVVVDDRTIDFTNLELRHNGETIRLTLMEVDLLRYFLRNSGRVISRKQILDEVWGLREDTDTRAIDNFIVRLRRYLEDDPAHPKRLLTVRGVGYRFEPEK
jgi:DNA-binding response OmpR family regulator